MRKGVSPGQHGSGDVLHGKTEEEIRKFFLDVFGISLEGYCIEVGRKRAYFSTAQPFRRGVTGIPLCRIGRGIKPTSYAMQVLGKRATKRRILLGKEDTKRFVEGYDIETVERMENGYVAVFFGSDCLGVGYFRNGVVENLLPKAMRREIVIGNPNDSEQV